MQPVALEKICFQYEEASYTYRTFSNFKVSKIPNND